MTRPEDLLSVKHAAEILGLTSAGLKLHDERLQPTRDSAGRRTYDRARVEAFAVERARKRAPRAPRR